MISVFGKMVGVGACVWLPRCSAVGVAEGVYVEATDSLDPAVTFIVVVFGGEAGWK